MREQRTFHYEPLDQTKRLAQTYARTTIDNLLQYGFQAVPESIGSSAFVFDMGDRYGAIVSEDLGTKSILADEMRQGFYDKLAQDTVAMITNDMITVGAMPVTVSPLWVSGSSDWFADTERREALISGWTKAVNATGATYAAGETAAFGGIVHEDRILLAGFSFGIVPKERLRLGKELQAGDRIILIESSGIHANGLTKAREIIETLPEKLLTRLSSGETVGATLLRPTHLYASLVKDVFDQGVDIHYMANITGHGWPKIMRANREFSYYLENIPVPPGEFSCLQRHGYMSDFEAYNTWNMGAGFAIFVPEENVFQTQQIARDNGFESWDAGVVEEGPKQVIIEPIGIVYGKERLNLR